MGNRGCSKTTVERDPGLCGFVPFIQDAFVAARRIRITVALLLSSFLSLSLSHMHNTLLNVDNTEAVLLVSLNIIMSITVYYKE